ncbi:uncharacterized protein [Nicotiana sylvestris]|uniref:uncharacterized protein n=1 Tax=Nicotiana sylvestris TaxID=4096 RepID=UPI00388CE772
MKAQALADHLAENPIDNEYQPLRTYFPGEEVNSVEAISEDTHAWKIFFDGAVNAKGVGIGAILISPKGQHYPATARLRFFCTNNTAEYEACIMGINMAIDQNVEELLIMGDSDLIIRQAQGEWETRDVKLIPYKKHVEDLSKQFKSIEFRYIPCCHNELADALATLASMLPYPGNAHIDPLEIQIRERHSYCNTIEAASNTRPWYHDIKKFLKTQEYPEQDSGDQKRTIKRHASVFFLSGDVFHLMGEICEQFKIMHRNSTPYQPKGNGAVEAANKNIKKILRKMIQSSRKWHEKLSFALFGYRTTVRTTIGATPYLLVYGTEAVILAEVEIPSLRIIVEAKIEDSEWVKTHLEQLTLIDKKRMAVAFDRLRSELLRHGARLRKSLDEGESFGTLNEEKEKKMEALEYLRGEVVRVRNACGELRAQMQAQALEEKGVLAKVPAFEAQLRLARDNASVQVDMIAKLESDLLKVRAERIDARAKAVLSWTKAD